MADLVYCYFFFFFQAEDGIRDKLVTGVQTCALPIWQFSTTRSNRMSIGPFKRRSSWPSSFVTGLIGWNGFFIIVGAALGQASRAGELFILGTAAAILEIAVLRFLFFVLRLDRRMLAGAFWGGLIGGALVFAETRVTQIFAG